MLNMPNVRVALRSLAEYFSCLLEGPMADGPPDGTVDDSGTAFALEVVCRSAEGTIGKVAVASDDLMTVGGFEEANSLVGCIPG
tara:strand:+ start:611 stop:862 length:252 start_codon:yes stop_codon:yes gene_type:complete